jgi:hypothetical protein
LAAVSAKQARGWRLIFELIGDPAERRMLPVLDLDPAIEAPGAIGALAICYDPMQWLL